MNTHNLIGSGSGRRESRRSGGWWLGAAAVAAGFMMLAGNAMAQGSGGTLTVNPGRDCQTIRTCNFARNGRVRGCLSSYSCRYCKTVRSRCNLGGRRYCERIVCSWGG
ncbi:MAG: hypothetical protein R3D67_01105 [Hyphomicrobiaceae bacterium]